MPLWLTLSLLLFAAAFCVARLVIELRAKRWWWALAAAVSAIGIVTVPIPTHAVKIDLPRS
ncbi:hypothetical protein DAH66_03470 [Sphingomonas koreensis]|uniref:Uncharacterized protein n=1 Tax=Sphingomonas koreensis TaxID=93064 RepID=A0A430G8A3_9SPHN|nr:hypothetical protein DAH66_03470 [Sphingomonas koreensis]